MRRTLLAVLTSTVALAIVPAAVVARGHERRHHRTEQRHHHRRHHERVRHERFGHAAGSEREARTAGTIKSFTGGVLTITRNDGSTVSGEVTDATRIRCDAPEPAEMRTDEDGSGGGDRGDRGDRGDDRGHDQGEDRGDDRGHDQGEDRGDDRGQDQGEDRGDDRGHDQGEDRGDDPGHDEGEERTCTTADLMPGTVVQEAELRISRGGSVWEEVELASRP